MNIPQLDISFMKEWQTVVDREKGVYIGHPTTVLLDDGKTILIVYPKSHGFGSIVLKKSADGGKTWSERLSVPESFHTSLEVPTIYKVWDKEGTERLILFSGLYPIRMSVSEDQGETWSELEPIGDYGGVVAMGDICEVGKGEYIAMFHDDGRFIGKVSTPGWIRERVEVFACGEGPDTRTKYIHYYSEDGGETFGKPVDHWLKTKEREGDVWRKIHTCYSGKVDTDRRFHLYQVRSKDGGLTWSDPETICHPENDKQVCEPAIVRSPDGKTLITLLRENTHKRNSFMLISKDNGTTWSEPVELPSSLTGDRHCARYLPDGRLFISFRDTSRDSLTWGDWVAWVGTFDDIIEGREGQYRLRIMKNYYHGDCAYPAIEILPDETIVTTTYGHFEDCEDPKDTEDAYIVSVRFKIEEAEAKAIVLKEKANEVDPW